MKPSVIPQAARWLLIGSVLLCAAFTARGQSPWKFIAVGDTRGSGSSTPVNIEILAELANEIVNHDAQFVIIPGDLVYSGSLANFQLWKSVMAPVYQAGIGVYPVAGNHDANDIISYVQVFGGDLPDDGPAGELNRTYSLARNNALILGLDTYVNAGYVNQAWVDSKLQQNTLPHVFAFGHMPAFKANHADCLDDHSAARDAFWNSLKQAGARVYFCGHDHFYDHMRVDDGDGNAANDVHQMIVGGGGAPLYTSYAYDGANTVWSPVNVYHANQYGYTVVEINGLTATLSYYQRSGPNTYVLVPSDVWVYTVGAPPPPAPTGLAATAGDRRVVLTWNAVPGATSYQVKRAVGSPTSAWTTVASTATTTYTDLNVVNGTTYYYAVTARNTAGESPSSSYVSATPQAPPSPPTAPQLSASVGRGRVNLTWTVSAGATSYTVKRSGTAGGPYTAIKSGLTATKYVDRKVKTGVTYYYIVTAQNAVGYTDSNEASATVTLSPQTGAQLSVGASEAQPRPPPTR